jgi:hypothetical protein
MRWLRRTPKHRHDFVRIGYGGSGWSLYRCACGEMEIDA